MSDPVASRSGFLCQYMSGHPDTLVAYVTHFGKVKGPLASAKMLKIDAGGMELSYVRADAAQTSGKVRVKFDPPLISYDEVRPRLTAMKYDAEEELGMIKRPPLTTFTFPPGALWGVGLVLLINIVYFRPAQFEALADSVTDVLPGKRTGAFIAWSLLVGAHAMETAYVLFVCSKHSAGLVLTTIWSVAVLLGGFPVLRELRHTVQQARIASIKQRAH